MTKVDLSIINASELLTLSESRGDPLGIVENGAVTVRNGKIVETGPSEKIMRKYGAKKTVDAQSRVVMPGFVDPHTHLVFHGDRAREFEERLKGKSYLSILARGGGILQTVRDTRAANAEELRINATRRLDIMLEHGTTCVEVKSGYGLRTYDELKILQVVSELGRSHPVRVIPTFLGAHAVPPDFLQDHKSYVDLVCNDMIPIVSKKRLAEFCDVFCEKGAFTQEESRRILIAGARHGLFPKIHADQLNSTGGALVAARVRAISADHLVHASKNGFSALRRAGTVPVLLPLSSFTLLSEEYADARQMLMMGLPVALGTDFSPSNWCLDQQTTIAVACRQLAMTPEESIVAATRNAAKAVRRSNSRGSLERGKLADVQILKASSFREIGYKFGENLVDQVYIGGRLMAGGGRRLSVRRRNE